QNRYCTCACFEAAYCLSITLCDSRLDEGTKVSFVACLEFGEKPIVACDGSPTERRAATAWAIEQGHRVDCLQRIVHCHFFAGCNVTAGNRRYLVCHPEIGVARVVQGHFERAI